MTIDAKQTKLKKEIADLEAKLELIPAAQRYNSPLYTKLIDQWNKLNPEAPASTEKPNATKISSADVCVHGSWSQRTRDTGEECQSPESEGCRGGFSRGVLAGAPTCQTYRINCPLWVENEVLFKKFGELLEAERIEEIPTEEELMRLRTKADLNLLKAYYAESYSYAELQIVGERPLGLRFIESPEIASEHVAEFKKRLRTLVNDGYRLLQIPKPSAEELRKVWQDRFNNLADRAQYGNGADPNSYERNGGKPDYNQARVLDKEYARLEKDEAAARRASRKRCL